MDLGGLGNMMGAVPGGYQQGMQANNQIEQQQLQLANERAKQVGTAAYFRALQTMMGPQGGQGPQPPNPGQPSMSTNAMPGPQMTPPMAMNNGQPVTGADGGIMPPMQTQQASGAAAPAGPPRGGQSPPGQPLGGQQLTWQGIIQSLKTSNPNASDLELAHAVDHFMPMMTMQNRLEWQQMKNELMYDMAGLRSETQRRGQDIRADTTTRGQDVRADTMDNRTQQQREQEEGRRGRFETSEDRRERSLQQRGDQFQQREQRLQDALKLRGDTTWARLEQQKQQAQQRVQQGDRRQAVIDWRAAVDAQHKMAMERIQATNISSGMKPAERTKLIEDQNVWYRGEIDRLRNMSTGRGNLTDQGEPTGQTTEDLPAAPRTPKAPPVTSAAPTAAAPAAGAQALPPAFKADPDGTKYQKGGKTWVKQGDQLVIENGP